MGCLTKAFVMAVGVAAAVGLTSKFHPEPAHHAARVSECAHTKPVPLHIAADGSVTFAGTRYTNRKLLAARFVSFAKHVPQTQVRLTPDKKSPYGDVAAVLTIAQNAGLHCLGFTGIEQSP